MDGVAESCISASSPKTSAVESTSVAPSASDVLHLRTDQLQLVAVLENDLQPLRLEARSYVADLKASFDD